MAKKEKTTKLTEFSRAAVRTILDECQEALAPIAEKYGLTLDRKGRTYQDDAMPVMYQFLIKEIGEDGGELSSAGKAFISHAPLYGLEPSDLGKEFESRGATYKITGFNPRSHKYPIQATNLKTGKAFKFTVENVKGKLKLAA